jgi:hypothetical protein
VIAFVLVSVLGQYSPALACYETALDETLLSDDGAFLLCGGAASTAPVECFLAARDELTFSDSENIDLCRCATSADPVACASYALDTTTLDNPQVIATCNARTVERLYLDCTPRL